jgi:hypothetical protein
MLGRREFIQRAAVATALLGIPKGGRRSVHPETRRLAARSWHLLAGRSETEINTPAWSAGAFVAPAPVINQLTVVDRACRDASGSVLGDLRAGPAQRLTLSTERRLVPDVASSVQKNLPRREGDSLTSSLARVRLVAGTGKLGLLAASLSRNDVRLRIALDHRRRTSPNRALGGRWQTHPSMS